MAYANTNTNMALRDVRQMVSQMPEQRSMREYRSALGRGEELRAMAGMKEAEMRLPALQLERDKAQDELDRMNAPFRIQNLARGIQPQTTAEGRQIVKNPDGSISTERTITIGVDGKYVNIPTMYNGKQVSPQEASQIAGRNGFKDPETGRQFDMFNSVGEAESAAQKRSQGLGDKYASGQEEIGPFDVKIFPDQAAMLVQDQKYGPPALEQFNQNLRQMGYNIQKDGTFTKKDGSPLTYREAAPVHREWLRTMFLNTDMEKHRDNQVAFLESKGELTPQETAGLQKLKATTPLQLAEMRLQKLQEIQMEDPMWGRDEGRLLQPMMEQAAQRVNELKGAAAEQSERNWEIQKMYQEHALDKDLKGYEASLNPNGGKDTRGSFQKDVEFYAQATGMAVPDAAELFRVDKTRAERLKMASAEIEANEMDLMGMEPQERQMFIQDVYRRYELVPGEQPQQGPQVGQDGSIYLDELPAQPDANGIVTINGQRFKVEQTGQPAQQEASPVQAQPAPQPQPAPVQQAPAPRAQPGAPAQTIEQWMEANPEAAREPGIMALINTNLSDEEKLRRIERKMKQMRKSFAPTPPMVIR